MDRHSRFADGRWLGVLFILEAILILALALFLGLHK